MLVQFIFFFQAEDGIRDDLVTGVQTCALPISISKESTERANAQDLITAIALAYEVNSRLVDSLDIAARGWDPPVFSLPAVALAAGKLMKLDPERLTHAVGLAINDHIPMAQTRIQTLSDW